MASQTSLAVSRSERVDSLSVDKLIYTSMCQPCVRAPYTAYKDSLYERDPYTEAESGPNVARCTYHPESLSNKRDKVRRRQCRVQKVRVLQCVCLNKLEHGR